MSTMIGIRIGNEERNLDEADESWVNQQINRRLAAGDLVCVQVRIQNDALDLALRTPTCPSMGGGGRAATRHEQEILNLWEKLGLRRMDFAGGNVVAFLKQLRRLV